MKLFTLWFSLLFGLGVACADEVRPELLVFQGGLKPIGTPRATELTEKLNLSASRGEIVNFMMQAKSDHCFSLHLGELKASHGSRHLDLAVYEAVPFKTEHASYRGAKVGDYLDPLIPRSQVCAKAGQETWILGELKIPEDFPPGDYEASLEGLGHVRLKLHVWKMKIPDKPAVPMYAELTTYYLLLGHYGKWHEGQAELAQKYVKSLLAHRIIPYKQAIRPIPVHGSLAYLGSNDEVKFEDSFESSVVEPLPEWAYLSIPFNTNSRQANQDTVQLQAVQSALEQRDWLSRSLIYLWDEPQKEDLSALRALGRAVRKSAPGMKTLVTSEYRSDLKDIVDIFVPIMDKFDYPGSPPVSVYDSWRARGKEFWLYVSCMSHGCTNDVDSGAPDWVIDRPGTHIRSQAWIASYYHAAAVLYYSVDNGFQFFSKGRDPWVSLWDFTGNGDGTLYYPGRPGLYGLTEQEPIESLRLKLWRQSSYDAEYLRWMNQTHKRPPWWPKLMRTLVRTPRDWEHSDSVYADAREKMGNYLDSQ